MSIGENTVGRRKKREIFLYYGLYCTVHNLTEFKKCNVDNIFEHRKSFKGIVYYTNTENPTKS